MSKNGFLAGVLFGSLAGGGEKKRADAQAMQHSTERIRNNTTVDDDGQYG